MYVTRGREREREQAKESVTESKCVWVCSRLFVCVSACFALRVVFVCFFRVREQARAKQANSRAKQKPTNKWTKIKTKNTEIIRNNSCLLSAVYTLTNVYVYVVLCFTFVIGKLCANIDPSVCVNLLLPLRPSHTVLGYRIYAIYER